MLRACAKAEAAGVRALAVVSSGFVGQARALALSLGIGHVCIAEYPGVISTDPPAVLEEKVRTVLVPRLAAGLAAGRAGEDGGGLPVPEPDVDSRFVGTFDEVQEHCHARGWSDGLPVVPPTVERVEGFLTFTGRDPGDVLGVLPSAQREATVWAVAVNGVMAGCRPEYLPVLLAVTEAVADPEFRLEDAGSTPGWEPLVVVSGPVVRELGFNSGTGVMRVGRRANSTVARFLRLLMRNVGGLRPGETDKATIGAGAQVALAEDGEAVAELGWPPFALDRGFEAGDSVVTVQSVVAVSPPIYSSGAAVEHLEAIAHLLGTTCGPWAFSGVWFGQWHPLLVLGPAVARVLAAGGYGKDGIRRYLFDHLRLPARLLDRCAHDVLSTDVTLADLVARGLAPPRYAESGDPDRPVPLLLRPDWTGIVVAGDPGRCQSRAYVANHKQGPPVSRPVRR